MDFYVRKIQLLRPGLNPQTWVPEASMLTTRPPKPSPDGDCYYISLKRRYIYTKLHGVINQFVLNFTLKLLRHFSFFLTFFPCHFQTALVV